MSVRMNKVSGNYMPMDKYEEKISKWGRIYWRILSSGGGWPDVL